MHNTDCPCSPVHDRLPSVTATRGGPTEADHTRAIKNSRRQSLPPQANFSSPLMPEVASRPALTRRPSDPISKQSLHLAPQLEPTNVHNTYDLSFPDETRRRKHTSAESLASVGSSLASGLWSPTSAGSSATSLAPTIHASSILDLKDMHIVPEERVQSFSTECQSAFDSATRNLAKILGLSLCESWLRGSESIVLTLFLKQVTSLRSIFRSSPPFLPSLCCRRPARRKGATTPSCTSRHCEPPSEGCCTYCFPDEGCK